MKYHEEYEKMRGTKITVADDPETLRAKRNMEIASQVGNGMCKQDGLQCGNRHTH